MKFLQAIIDFFKKKSTTPVVQKPVEARPVEVKPAPVVEKPVEPKKPEAPAKPRKKKLPTRLEMVGVIMGFIDGSIPTRIGPYKTVKEIPGKNNRSKQIDMINTAQGGDLGDPYCQAGMQEQLDELCRYFNISRKLVKIPEGVGTQDIWKATSPKYKNQIPYPCMWVNWKHLNNPGHGHTGGTLTGLFNGTKFKTDEFNTTAAGQKVVRDGEGFYTDLVRDINGYDDARINGFIDIYQAIIDVLEASGEYEG